MNSVNKILKSVDQAASYAIDNAPSMARKLSSVAIPAIALIASSYTPGADAGPVSYAACVLAGAGIIVATPGPFTLAECEIVAALCNIVLLNPFLP